MFWKRAHREKKSVIVWGYDPQEIRPLAESLGVGEFLEVQKDEETSHNNSVAIGSDHYLGVKVGKGGREGRRVIERESLEDTRLAREILSRLLNSFPSLPSEVSFWKDIQGVTPSDYPTYILLDGTFVPLKKDTRGQAESAETAESEDPFGEIMGGYKFLGEMVLCEDGRIHKGIQRFLVASPQFILIDSFWDRREHSSIWALVREAPELKSYISVEDFNEFTSLLERVFKVVVIGKVRVGS